MLYCGKPPREKYKKTGENIKKHDLFIYFYLFLSIFLSAPTAQDHELNELNELGEPWRLLGNHPDWAFAKKAKNSSNS